MKYILEEIFILLLCFESLCGIPARADQPPTLIVPKFDDLSEIVLSSSGWMLEIRKDGSGGLAFGSNSADVALIPKGSFDCRGIYNALLPTLKETPPGSNSVAVALHKVGEVSVSALYSNERSVIINVFDAARRTARPVNRTRFEQLLRERPLLPETH